MGHRRAEEPLHRPGRARRDRAVPRPGPARPAEPHLRAAVRGALRRGPHPGLRHHPPGRRLDGVLCRSTRAPAAPGSPAARATRRRPPGTPAPTCGSRCGSATPGWTCCTASCRERAAAKGEPRSVLFPRYHQWDVVRRLVAHAAEHGPGHSYLLQHSAGSGKSNSIAWLAHRLADLHTPSDAGLLAPLRGGRRAGSGHQGVRQGRRHHRPQGAGPAAAGHHQRPGPRARGAPAHRRRLPAAARGPGGHLHQDRHHHAAEVPRHRRHPAWRAGGWPWSSTRRTAARAGRPPARSRRCWAARRASRRARASATGRTSWPTTWPR